MAFYDDGSNALRIHFPNVFLSMLQGLFEIVFNWLFPMMIQMLFEFNFQKSEIYGFSLFKNVWANFHLQKFCKLGSRGEYGICRSRQVLSNEHLLGNFGFEAAENEPLEI